MNASIREGSTLFARDARVNGGIPAPHTYRRAAAYDPQWVRDNALGENALCQVEGLAFHMPFRRGMRVLDLACGKATSSIFLAREYDVEVWAVDGSISPTDNLRRAADMDCEGQIFPLRAEAHGLPFAKQFFDAVIAVDSFLYFGTDDRYLPYLLQFIKPGGYLGIVDIAFSHEIPAAEEAPAYLRGEYGQFWSSVHSIDWWRQHWQKTALVDIVYAGVLPDSDAILLDYATGRGAGQQQDHIMRAVPRDEEGLLSLFCLVARKRP